MIFMIFVSIFFHLYWNALFSIQQCSVYMYISIHYTPPFGMRPLIIRHSFPLLCCTVFSIPSNFTNAIAYTEHFPYLHAKFKYNSNGIIGMNKTKKKMKRKQHNRIEWKFSNVKAREKNEINHSIWPTIHSFAGTRWTQMFSVNKCISLFFLYILRYFPISLFLFFFWLISNKYDVLPCTRIM